MPKREGGRRSLFAPLLAVAILGGSPAARASSAPECKYLPAVNDRTCQITQAPPSGAGGIKVASSNFPTDPGNIEVFVSLAPPPGKSTLTVNLTGTVNIRGAVTLAHIDLSCADARPSVGLYHRFDGIRADGFALALRNVRVTGCGHRGIFLANSSGNDLAEVDVKLTGLREPNTATSPASSFAAIELDNVSDSILIGIGIGNWTSAGQSGGPTAAGVALSGGSHGNVLASVYVNGHDAQTVNGAATGPAIQLGNGATLNQIIRTRVRNGSLNSQRVVCGAGTADNLWHHNTFDRPGGTCPLSGSTLGTGNGLEHGDPEEPDPSDTSRRKYSPRIWTVCFPASFARHFCDNRHPGSTPDSLPAEDYVGDFAAVIATPGFFYSGSPFPNRFLAGDILLADTFPLTPGWNGFTVPNDRPLWLAGNTRTQEGTYNYTVRVHSASPPDIGPAMLPAEIAPFVRIQHVRASTPSNAVVIDPQ